MSLGMHRGPPILRFRRECHRANLSSGVKEGIGPANLWHVGRYIIIVLYCLILYYIILCFIILCKYMYMYAKWFWVYVPWYSNRSGHFMSAQLRNCMVSRCCICIFICCILKVPFILEQPASSVLEAHPEFQLLAKRFKIFKAPQQRFHVVW